MWRAYHALHILLSGARVQALLTQSLSVLSMLADGFHAVEGGGHGNAKRLLWVEAGMWELVNNWSDESAALPYAGTWAQCRRHTQRASVRKVGE